MSTPRFAQWRPHPWHGLPVGPAPPERVFAFIEITPLDPVKDEIDKQTGYLRVDRPQRTSSLPPALYGFIPRTYCGEAVAARMPGAKRGDQDPLDVCVFSERPIRRADIVLEACVIGGRPMVDGGEADDKIVAVGVDDSVWGGVRDLEEFPVALVDRLCHASQSRRADRSNQSRSSARPAERPSADRPVRALARPVPSRDSQRFSSPLATHQQHANPAC